MSEANTFDQEWIEWETRRVRVRLGTVSAGGDNETQNRLDLSAMRYSLGRCESEVREVAIPAPYAKTTRFPFAQQFSAKHGG